MKSEGMLTVKIIEIDRQHTPTPRLCSSQAKGVDKDLEDRVLAALKLKIQPPTSATFHNI